MKEPELVSWEEVPETDLIHLLRVAIGGDGQLRTTAFWRWKHRNNPFGPSPGLVALDAAGRPVALRVFLRWGLEAGETSVRAVRAVDTATHPDWQRKGLFRRLTTALLDRLADEGVDFVFNTPNPRSLAGYLSMGWQQVGRLPLLLKPRRPLRGALRRLRGTPDTSCAPLGLQSCDEVLAGPEVGHLLGRQSHERRLHTRHSVEYLRWRYVDMPAFRYGALTASRGSSVAAGVFRLRRRDGMSELSVSELFASRGTDGARLGADVCRRAVAATGADYGVAIANRRHVAWPALWRAGFLPFSFPGPVLVVRRLCLRPPAVDPSALENWCVTVGDMELF